MQQPKRTISINGKDFEFFISENELMENIQRMGREISLGLAEEENPLFVCVLNGSFMFTSDLMAQMDQPYEMSFTIYSSYKGLTSTGKITEILPIQADIKDRTIILMEDIIDSGATMLYAKSKLKEQGAKEVKIATMLFKPDALKVDLTPDYVGMEIPNDFIVGHGLDYDQKGRGLRDIYKIVQTTEC